MFQSRKILNMKLFFYCLFEKEEEILKNQRESNEKSKTAGKPQDDPVCLDLILLFINSSSFFPWSQTVRTLSFFIVCAFFFPGS